MKKRLKMKPALVSIALLSGFCNVSTFAQNSSPSATTPYGVELNIDKQGIDISPTLNGIFFEDINQSNDGGISAQLIQNNSFQAYNVPGSSEFGPAGKKVPEFSKSPTEIYGWSVVNKGGAVGTVTTVDAKPLVTYKKLYNFDEKDQYDDALKYKQYCVQFKIEKAGQGFGLAANGFGITKQGSEKEGNYYSNNTQTPSIAVNAGVKYDLGLYLQGEKYKGTISVYLEDASGKINSNIVSFKKISDSWKKFKGQLTAQRSVDSRLVIQAGTAGTFYLDFVTLVPEASQLWRDGKFGDFRKDMLEALEKLHPKFMRFPGGCASEGSNYWGQYFWKNTIGPVEERIGIRNHWGYWTSQHIGFYEYFQMAEALGATPLPVINNGVTCQFAGRSYIAPLGTDEEKKRFYDIYVKDALDLIEFCNGDASTEWGAKRIALGHPKPFNLQYIGIGNENSGEAFWERFDIIYKAVKEKYPNINVITTSGAGPSGKEFDTNYAIIDQKYSESIVDEHYYSTDNWFYTNTHRYDADKVRGNQGNTYNREKPTRVFVGEFANSRTNNAYISTLAEAAYSIGLERNSDMVVMAAYAPLFCKKGFAKWGSNLIWFDNRGLWRTTNYYYQYLFANNMGNKAIGISPFYKTADQSEDAKVYTSPTLDTKTGIVYVKVVNSENAAKETTVQINGGASKSYKATMEYLTSNDTAIKNQGDQNVYSSAPGVENSNYDEAITPKAIDLGVVSGSFKVTLPINSVNVIKLVPVR
jgi:alpha-L-arabinofuranosidase